MTTPSLAGVRRDFAEQMRDACKLRSDALVDALATVPREAFLPPGPWFVRGERSPAGNWTADADPTHLYAPVSVAIDASRELYNGHPGQVAAWIDALAIAPGDRALHIGCATGYFTALLAEMTGPRGHVHALDVDAGLAAEAATNLAPWPWVSARAGDGRSDLPRDLDVILVHAGASHVVPEWLDALRDGGRLLVPLTCTMPGMASTLSKGGVLVLTRDGDDWRVRPLSFVMIYALVGLRDDDANRALGQAFMSGGWDKVSRATRRPHPKGPECWHHTETFCLAVSREP
jgi:protein-L-isoaspartate(D-aspartate) O-methyltransferase